MNGWKGRRSGGVRLFPPARATPQTQPRGQMNKTEAAYRAEMLEPRLHAGELTGIWYEGLKLRLAQATFYTPDFLVQLADGTLELHEVKGFMRDDAAVKLKVVAELYPFPVYVVRRVPAKQGGGWTVTPIKPEEG